MKNFVQPGEYGVPVVTPNAVTSGQVVVIGQIVGIAATDAAAGATVSLAMEGVYDLPKVPADAHAAGDIAKVNASGVVDLAGTVNIGWIIQAVLAGSTTVRVRLCPTP
jgi:predicted RecA/RadA family phage recombinase